MDFALVNTERDLQGSVQGTGIIFSAPLDDGLEALAVLETQPFDLVECT